MKIAVRKPAAQGALFYLQARAFRTRLWPIIPALRAHGVQRILVVGDPGFPNNAEIAEEVYSLGGQYVAVDWQHQGPTQLLAAVGQAFDVPVPEHLLPIPYKPRRMPLAVDAQEVALHVTRRECLEALEYYRYSMSVASTVLDMINACFFLADQDTVLTNSAAWVYAVQQRRGVAAVAGFLSQLYLPSLKELPFRYPHRRVTSSLGRFIHKNFSQWTAKLAGEPILRVPPWEALAMEVLGLAPPFPWIIDSGYLDRIYLESTASLRKILQVHPCMSGAPFVLTGSPAHDTIYVLQQDKQRLRSEFAAQYALDPAKPTLLLALPGTCEGLYPTAGFASFEEAMLSIVHTTRTAFDGNMIISLHPRATGEHKELLRQGSWIVSSEGSDRLLHLCDYVVNTGSTITPWALMLGLPVLDYHIYIAENGEHLYSGDDAQGLLVVDDFPSFKAALAVLGKVGRWEELAEKSQRGKDVWGRLDGRCAERIVEDLFEQLKGKNSRCVVADNV